MVGLEGGRIRLIGCRGLEGRGLGCRGLGCRGACGALFVFWWVGFAGRARSDEHSRGRSGPWLRWWGGFGGWLLVAEGDAGASGAAFPRWSVGTISTRRIGTISVGGRSTSKMVRTAHPTLGRAWGAGGSGVGSGRGGVLGKQERPGSGGCRAGWDAGVRRGDQAWVLRRRATAARPARPVPKSSMVAGSGTTVSFPTEKSLSVPPVALELCA